MPDREEANPLSPHCASVDAPLASNHDDAAGGKWGQSPLNGPPHHVHHEGRSMIPASGYTTTPRREGPAMPACLFASWLVV